MAEPWLASLPRCPLQRESSETLGKNTVDFMPDAGGSPMSRQLGTAVYDQVSLVFLMTWQQVHDFKNWFRSTLRHGAVEFTLASDPFTRDEATYKFAAPPRIDPFGATHFRVSFDAFRKPA